MLILESEFMRDNKYTVLVVEDDNKLRMTICDYLSTCDFEVLFAEDGVEAVEIFSNNFNKIHIVLLDGMLPKMDGLDVLKTIRKQSSVPVIMISARESETDQIKGLRFGADAYFTKPFLLSVLKEQINVLISRVYNKSTVLTAGKLEIDIDSRKVYLNKEFVETTPKEFDVLVYLVENQKIVLERDKILDNVWGIDYFGDFRTVDTIIKQLRKKLTDKYPYINSVYGVGYYFEA